MSGANIDLHIEELVLHGFSTGDRYRIADALQVELTRLISEQGLASPLMNGGEIQRIDAGAFEMQPGSRGNVVGGQIAQTVHQGLTHE